VETAASIQLKVRCRCDLVQFSSSHPLSAFVGLILVLVEENLRRGWAWGGLALFLFLWAAFLSYDAIFTINYLTTIINIHDSQLWRMIRR
jgi:hypothetical protein